MDDQGVGVVEAGSGASVGELVAVLVEGATVGVIVSVMVGVLVGTDEVAVTSRLCLIQPSTSFSRSRTCTQTAPLSTTGSSGRISTSQPFTIE
jgi:hypothetical protein